MRGPGGECRALARQRGRLPGRHPPLSPAPLEPRLARSLEEARQILFLCSGNLVRSAFAELYANHRACPLPVGSAATHFRGDGPLPETVRALRARGVSAALIRAFRPRHIDDVAPALDERTLVLAMSRMHLSALDRWPALRARGFLLAGVLGSATEIADPVLEGAPFEDTFERVAASVDQLVLRLGSTHAS